MKNILNALTYLVAFIAIQLAVTLAVESLWQTDSAWPPILISALSAVLTILLFVLARWSPFSRNYLRSRPWALLAWVAIMTFGTVIPSEFLVEKLGLDVPEHTRRLFEQIMQHPAGYFVIGILVPVAEEMVFRGAILRTLLKQWSPWVAIVAVALLFGLVHGNVAQFIHAFLLGLLLGWLYWRSGSIVPGIVLHWTNNTIVYVVYKLLPQTSDSTLLELFGGSQRAVWMSLLCSMCIFLPALFQVIGRIRKQE